MSTTATVEKIDYDAAITEAGEAERKADAKADELRARQRSLLRDSLRGVDTSKELSQVSRGLDRAARDAENARILGEEATAEKATAVQREKAAQRERARVELARLDRLRGDHLLLVENALQVLAGELVELRRLDAKVLSCRATLELGGLGVNVSRMIGDRLSFVLGRGAGSAGLSSLPPLASKGQARTPLPELFATATEDRV